MQYLLRSLNTRAEMSYQLFPDVCVLQCLFYSNIQIEELWVREKIEHMARTMTNWVFFKLNILD